MEHIAFVCTQHNATVKFVRSDRGGEYLPTEVHNYFAKCSMKHELTVHDSPQQNGVAEHTNQTLVENACVMLFRAGFPRALWAEAISHATYLKNRSPTRALVDKTPYEKVHGLQPDLSDMHRFGCPVYVRIKNTGKLDEQAKQARFIGYDYNSKGYRVYWPKSRHISIERNVHFLPDDLSVPSDSPNVEFKGEDDTVIDSPTSQTPDTATHTPPTPADIPLPSSPLTTPPSTPLPRPTGLPDEPPTQNLTQCVTRSTKFPPGYYSRGVFDHNEQINAAMEFDEEMGCACDELSAATEHADVSLESDEPSVEEALRGPNAEHWQHTMDEEVAAIEKNGTWEIVDPPHSTNIIRSHFILKVKHDEKGEIARINFNKTFAAVAKLPSVRAVLANAASQGWEIHQIDIKNAYLNAELLETIYMCPPPRCLKPGQEGKAGFEWYETLRKFFIEIRFTWSAVDHTVFFRHEGEFLSVISISTDDMVISGNTIESINWVKGEFKKRFEVSDLREIKWLLGLEVKYNKAARTLSISQSASVTWSALATQPDISFPSSTLSQFMQNPGRAHWEAGKRVVRYLKGTCDYVLILTDPDEGIIAYVDADWGSQHHRHSISGHIVSLTGMPIAWGSKKQSIVALLSTEAKYVAMTNALKDILWL
ncbi:hypothetical protein SCLCIDRAFT_33370 [Scleroderma citrinum Foug A]|uniref:Integrase catalytic domain-containing protein n=1 Tax=Scleroderma citrinum Foug A TaxID=1036808 RepID=A0A0C2ZF22_9AGAM|nr:hypothetical protein SCLCIDRAFT_33370 [Scleroderma citrinum Foug A]